MVTNDFGSSEVGSGVLTLPNGKIVQVGRTNVEGSYDFAIARYNPGGTLDNTFGGGDGRVTTDFFGNHDGGWGVARYGNSKIVVAGWTENAAGDESDFALARYKSGGALDDTFGGDGRVTTAFPHAGYAYDILVLNDGSMVVVGEDYGGTSDDFALAKYKPNGNLDSSFSGDGKVTTDFAGGFDRAVDVLRLGDRLLLTGQGQHGSLYDVALARYRMNGSLDSSFGGDGKRLISLTPATDEGREMVRVTDERIVIAVRASADVGLLGIRPNGALDGTFGGGDGKVIRDFGGGEYPGDLMRTGTKLVVGGRTIQENEQAVWRFGLKGGVDLGFGIGGEAVSDYPSQANGFDIAKHDGAVVISGDSGGDLAVSRFLLS